MRGRISLSSLKHAAVVTSFCFHPNENFVRCEIEGKLLFSLNLSKVAIRIKSAYGLS